ncbi:hypothetical protein EAE99_003725 [Botrytis elliptica]|nr:hypothetical protein EAE99_003725 [Botrytis elliptica]
MTAQPQQANNMAAYIPNHPELQYTGVYPNRRLVINFRRNGGDDILDLIKQYTLLTERLVLYIDFTQPSTLTPAEQAAIKGRVIKIRDAINYVAPGALFTSNKILTVQVLVNMSQFSTWRLKSCAGLAELVPRWDLRWQINGGATRTCYRSEFGEVVDLEQIIINYAHRKVLHNDG